MAETHKPSTTAIETMEPDRQRAILFGRRFDWVITLVVMVTAILFIIMLRDLPQRATFFPWFITISIMIVGSVYAFGKIKNPSRWDAHYDPEFGAEHDERDIGPAYLVPYARRILKTLLIFTTLIAATVAIGPEYAVPLFVAIMLWSAGENKIIAVASGIAFWVIIHFVFGDFMSINLPTGYLTDFFFQ